MVALMDYTRGDVARPALVPGWTGIDFNPGGAGSGLTWLDSAPLTAADFADYRPGPRSAFRNADHALPVC